MTKNSMHQFINGLPKAELHLHIEGSFEPEQMFQIARRNNKAIPFSSVDELKKAYYFNNLQDFLDIYYEGAGVLIEEQDFFDLTWTYLTKIHRQNVIHTEVFFDPQTHTERGIPFATVINGISQALEKAKKELGISSKLIMCFLRHLDEENAFKTFHSAIKFKNLIAGVGLDSSEVGNPPSKFRKVFEAARNEGFFTVAHAGEEGPASYIWEAINILKISRIDHGNKSIDDKELMNELIKKQIPLTLCPLSNLKLKVVDNLQNHPLKLMLQKGLLATVNSDDPAYFGGYLTENYVAVQEALNLSKEDITQLAMNSFRASFLPESTKEIYIQKVKDYANANILS